MADYYCVKLQNGNTNRTYSGSTMRFRTAGDFLTIATRQFTNDFHQQPEQGAKVTTIGDPANTKEITG